MAVAGVQIVAARAAGIATYPINMNTGIIMIDKKRRDFNISSP